MRSGAWANAPTDVIYDFLRECGLEPIGPVGELESALHMARVRALDGAILDINLKSRPCYPVCAVLSARRVPFVFLTGYHPMVIPAEYRSAPIISKPFDPEELKAVVTQMLGLTGSMLPTDGTPPTLRQ
jgi:DNA-binding response OmpR family regulator